MRIALFGANGQVGKRIATEALDRGHDLLAVVRNPATARLDDRAYVTAGDATYGPMVRAVVEGVDVVVSAIGPRKASPDMLVRSAGGVLAGMAATGVGRVLVIACAEEDPEPVAPAAAAPAAGATPATDDAPDATSGPKRVPVRSHGPAPAGTTEEAAAPPAAEGPTLAGAHRDVLAVLKASPDEVSWTWICPTVPCVAGDRSGAYLVGSDATTATAGLTLEDLAVAVLDEVEQPSFGRREMAVAGVVTDTVEADRAADGGVTEPG